MFKRFTINSSKTMIPKPLIIFSLLKKTKAYFSILKKAFGYFSSNKKKNSNIGTKSPNFTGSSISFMTAIEMNKNLNLVNWSFILIKRRLTRRMF